MKPSNASHPKIILVVEDELSLQNVIKKKLEVNGFETLTAKTIAEARQHLKKMPRVDAIWLDHYLPGGESGLDLVASLKEQDSPWRSTPLFVVSNTATAEKVQAYIRYGITKYFVKSNVSLASIIQDIKRVLEGPTPQAS